MKLVTHHFPLQGPLIKITYLCYIQPNVRYSKGMDKPGDLPLIRAFFFLLIVFLSNENSTSSVGSFPDRIVVPCAGIINPPCLLTVYDQRARPETIASTNKSISRTNHRLVCENVA